MSNKTDFSIRFGCLINYRGKDKNVVIPDDVTVIGRRAFFQNNYIDSVTIPASVTEVQQEAFTYCDNLKTITILGKITKAGVRAFGWLYDKEDLELSVYSSVSIGAFTKSAQETALRTFSKRFSEFDPTTETYRNNLKFIGTHLKQQKEYSGQFYQYGIDCIYDGPGGDVVIPQEIGSLDFSDTFKNAKNITGLFLPKSAKKITIKAFGSRATLRKVEFSEGTEEIPETNFFANCKALEEVVLPESLQYIGAGVFKNTPWYSNTIEVVDGCYYLGRFLVDSKEDISVASVCEGTTMICGKAFQNRTGLTEINIPDSVRTIGAYAFFGCTSLTEVSLPNQISRIEKWSFGGCNSLKQIDIPVTDAEISEDAFGSEKFGGLFFPDYAFIPTDLKGTAGQMRFFVYCYLTSRERHTSDRQKKYDAEAKKRKAKLLEIALENKNLSVLRNLAPIAITNANIAELIETTQQRNAPDMTAFLLEWQEKHFGQADLEKQQRKEMNRNPLSAGELKKIWGTKKLSDGTLGITSYKGSDIDICIPDCIGKTKITVICSSAFSVFGPLGKTIPEAYTAARKQIRSVIIPDGITSIGFFAFDCCTKMESITIPVTVNAINMAFTHCPNLTIHAPAGSYAEQYAKEHNIPFVAE